jgi:predicted dehydrogenase
MGTSGTSLRAAVVGLGIGRHHVEAYAAHPRVELAALCDGDPTRRQSFLNDHPGTRGYATLDEMLASEELDLVSICTPDWMHADMGIAALKAGAHVISTKPFTTTIADARRFIAAADETGRILMVAHERRYHPIYQVIKSAIDEGLLGELFYVEIDYFTHKENQFNRTPWYKSADHPRSAILGTGSHAVDLMRWFGGEVTAAWGVSNHLAYPDFPDDDCVLGVYKLANGAIGRVTQTYATIRAAGTPDLPVTIHGTKGSIENDKIIARALYDNAPAAAITGKQPWIPLQVPKGELSSFHRQVVSFVDCLLDGRYPNIDGREGARTVAACLAVDEACETGQWARPAACTAPRARDPGSGMRREEIAPEKGVDTR